MPYQYVQKAVNGKYSILTTTDFNGSFTFSAKFPTTAYFLLEGPYATVCNFPANNGSFGSPCTNNLVVEQALSIGSNQLILNPTYSETQVAQVNSFYRIGQMREWMYAINPLDDTFDGGAPYKVRTNRPNQDPCNAAFSGLFVWFPSATGDCMNNLAYASIIWHEMGHWMTERYGHLRPHGGAAQQAYNEGVADVWATFLSDYPCIGLGGLTRCGTDTVDEALFCPCRNGHDGGRPLMAALWQVRSELKATYQDDELGGAIANSLFLAWMSFTRVGKIRGYIEHEWLVLDDLNGILTDGTPNFADIDDGFLAKGFPGFSLPYTEPTECPSPPCPQ
jgi:hypothetical protein